MSLTFACRLSLRTQSVRNAQRWGGSVAHASSVAKKTKELLGTNIHFTEPLEDGSIFVSRVPKTLPEIKMEDLPPPVREYTPVERKEMTSELKNAVRKLRSEDPAHWTVSRLAKKFDLPPQAVLMIAPCPKWRRDQIQKKADEQWESSGYKKRLIRINRLRRRMLW